MDGTDEPQKKVFKARKTMRVSDRQQLEAVYKAKEDLLKTAEVKLLNGKHENGDSDINSSLSNTDCLEDKKEVNGLVDFCLNSEEGRTTSNEIREVKSPESSAESVVSGLEPKPRTLSPANVTPEQKTDTALAREAENGVLGSNKFHEENSKKDRLDQRESNTPSEGENKPSCDNSDSSEETGQINDIIGNSHSSVEEEKRDEEVSIEDAVGEAAISSSMEADQEPKDDRDSTGSLSETTAKKAIDQSSGGILENSDSMETDEIIPILEKLAPAEDELSCFSKSSLLPVDDTAPDLDEKMDNCLGSPSKQESNENLPKEAFLVLSDEEDPCDEKECAEVILSNKSSLPEEMEEERKSKEEDKDSEDAHKDDDKHTERSEVSRRKRSKSEDMDSVHSKRRRYVGEDYEAELQVKITARRDVDQKLQKVIQRLLEEKLAALQCAVFDKTLADLKMRIEKIECNKRHKTVLTELQAKVARLTKRFGAAKEDLKKRQENPPNSPLSPVKAASDTVSTTNTTYRNAGTVRQMLESKRSVGVSTTTTFQASLSTENQTSRPATDTSANKRTAEGTTQSGKVAGSNSGGVIDLTLDDEDDGSSQAESKKQNQTPASGLSISSQPLSRPMPSLQPTSQQQTGVPTSGPSQTTIHVVPTAPTTVNVTHRPVTQSAARLPIPRAPANHQVVYTTIPAPPPQNPVRGAVMPSPNLRPVNPQTGGMTVRMPQTTAYVVNNGLSLGSGAPQLTVHHRPPQVHAEPPRPIHPAPLPEAPQPPRLPPEAANTSLPQKPQLKLARVQSQNGIVLSWSVLEVDRSCASVDSYHLYAYHEDPSATMPSQWKKIGEVKALPLPMACTLTQFVSGSKYYFAVRAKDIYGRFGPFCDPQSTDVISSQSS
ncbi:activating transcription factor 7-interacting protein 1 isoform X11 [Anas platyrhynchos]|uniref:activating transcription factor 7-interacting protein 1 isoform X11 n=1 Tax=Anas platyrhynchos TaxID=8839 RepID=UPI00065E6E21|eukprot:XP_027309308.1 activating transcription factor 7-interacting protein 1 isoform X10 [Anas platyrhynchos]